MKQHNLHFAVRVVCCILLLTLAYVLQSSLGVRVSIFGVHIDILPLIVAAVGIVMGSGAGLACGLFAGLLYDVAGTGVEGLYPLYYMFAALRADRPACIGFAIMRWAARCCARQV